jgi:hypothetical protein
LPLPWVSRERFNEERARREKAEADLEALRLKFLDYLERHPAALPPIGEDTDLSRIQPIAGKPTIAMVTAKANLDAFKRATTPGSKGIAQELEENQAKMYRPIKAAANGN